MKCSCPHHKTVPILLVIFGLVFLLGQWGVLSSGAVSTLWPIIVIAAGLFKLTERWCKCC